MLHTSELHHLSNRGERSRQHLSLGLNLFIVVLRFCAKVERFVLIHVPVSLLVVLVLVADDKEAGPLHIPFVKVDSKFVHVWGNVCTVGFCGQSRLLHAEHGRC